MKKVLTVLVVLVLALAGVVAWQWWGAREKTIMIQIVRPHASAAWASNCKTSWVDGGESGGSGEIASVAIVNDGTKIQQLNSFRVYFWQDGIILDWLSYPSFGFNYRSETLYVAPDEKYSFVSDPDQFAWSETGSITCSVTAIS